jgi:negative regulator of flagellin synthesis FlgM
VAVNLTGTGLEPLSGTSLGTARKATSSQQQAQPGTQDATPQQGDVNITSTASLLANLEQALSAQPAIDQNRVAAISKSLEDGTYTIEPAKIASGLLNFERSLNPLPRAEI